MLALIAGYAAAQSGFARLRGQATPSRRFFTHLAALAFTSLLAGGASMPFAAYQFQQIQPYWILANLVAVPLTAFWVMPLGLAALALMPLGLAWLALLPMGWGISVIVWMTQCIAAWPGAMMRIEPMPNLSILLFSFGLIWLGLWRSRPRFAGGAFMAASVLVYFMARPPDVLVSPDARLIAISAGKSLFLLRQPKAQNYTLTQWQPVWAGSAFTTVDPAAPPPGVACGGGTACSFATGRGAVLAALAPPAAGCGDAVLVVSPQPLRQACASQTVIDRFSVWRNGAMAAWTSPHGVVLLSDRQVQGDRPWVPPWPSWHNFSRP